MQIILLRIIPSGNRVMVDLKLRVMQCAGASPEFIIHKDK